MAHVSREELLRVSDAEPAEVERLASHLADCRLCRALGASLLEGGGTPARRNTLLKPLLELARFERETVIGHLLARAEWAELQRLPRGAQKARVIRSRSCHTSAFLDVLLASLRSNGAKHDSELLSSLALLAAQGTKTTPAYKNDLLATIWIETANARRVSGEWNHAQAALLRAEKVSAAGTANRYVKARWLSIAASLRSDQGERGEAMSYLEECRRTYEQRGEWPWVARILIQMAHSIVDDDPGRGLVLLDRAEVLTPAAESTLWWLLESLRTECLITLNRVEEALRAFERAELLRAFHDRPNARLRATFTAARLLEACGRAREAEILFDEVVTGDLEHGLHKDAWLDLLYLVGFHARQSAPERAVAATLRTLGEIDRQEVILHEQLRAVWAQLIAAARAESLDQRMLAEARQYLKAHWKHPAPAEPVFSREGRILLPSAPGGVAAAEARLEFLLAKAHGSLIRREPERKEQLRLARSREWRTRAFPEALLADLRTAGSREDAELIAPLAIAAVETLDAPPDAKHDLLGEVWVEVANSCRIGSEWSRADAALRRADAHLAQGTGGLLVRGRRLSVEASLRADQGRSSAAVILLERCQAIYEELRAWPLVARILIQMAHVLVDSEPERGLALLDQAAPLVPAADGVLRWLAASLRTEYLIETREIGQALQAFQLAEALRGSEPRADAARRSDFTAARLLEALGRTQESERLFEGVIADAFEHEAYREAFLDLLYLFGHYVRRGAAEKAVAACRLAITRMDLFDLGHEPLRRLWVELLEAAKRQAVSPGALAVARDLLQAHWRSPTAAIRDRELRSNGRSVTGSPR